MDGRGIANTMWGLHKVRHPMMARTLANVASHVVNNDDDLKLSPGHTALVAWVLADFGYRDPSTAAAFANRVGRHVHELDERQLSMAAVAFSTFGVTDSPVLFDIAEATLKLRDKVSGPNLLNITRAVCTAGQPHERLLMSAVKRATRVLAGGGLIPPKGWGDQVGGLVKLGTKYSAAVVAGD